MVARLEFRPHRLDALDVARSGRNPLRECHGVGILRQLVFTRKMVVPMRESGTDADRLSTRTTPGSSTLPNVLAKPAPASPKVVMPFSPIQADFVFARADGKAESDARFDAPAAAGLGTVNALRDENV